MRAHVLCAVAGAALAHTDERHWVQNCVKDSECCCSGVPNPGGDPTYIEGRKGYGQECAHWDAADEKSWCIVEKGACGEGTFQSGKGHWWSHKPCSGYGLPFVPDPSSGGAHDGD